MIAAKSAPMRSRRVEGSAEDQDINTIVQVPGLTKSFGDVQAVADVDFDLCECELFGFLSPNGAGKTTTINMLTGLARPNMGMICIGGADCSADPKAAQHPPPSASGRRSR